MSTPATSPKRVSLARLFAALDSMHEEEQAGQAQAGRALTAMERHMAGYVVSANQDGIKRMNACRRALDALDRQGWQRSFHQRLFHEEYLKSCARVFFKRDGPGAFARMHNRLLEVNSWESTPQASEASGSIDSS